MLIARIKYPSACANLLRLGIRLTALPLAWCAMLAGGCSSPSSPTKFEPPPGAYRATLTAVKGGAGFVGMSITPKPIPEGTMAADISVRLKALKGNTTFFLQRAQ